MAESGDLAAVLLELQRHGSELRRIRERLEAIERQSRRRTLKPGDRERLATWLPPIVGVRGSDLFTVGELFESSEASLRLITADTTPQAMGCVFRRAIGHVIRGLTVQRDGAEGHAVLWRIVAASPGP